MNIPTFSSPIFLTVNWFDYSHASRMKWHLTVILICTSLVTSDTEHLFISLLPFVYRLCRNGYSNLLPIFCHFTDEVLFLIFKGISILFSMVAISTYICTNWERGLPFLHILPLQTFIVCRFFDDGHSDWCETISHCSSDLHFSINEHY